MDSKFKGIKQTSVITKRAYRLMCPCIQQPLANHEQVFQLTIT